MVIKPASKCSGRRSESKAVYRSVGLGCSWHIRHLEMQHTKFRMRQWPGRILRKANTSPQLNPSTASEPEFGTMKHLEPCEVTGVTSRVK